MTTAPDGKRCIVCSGPLVPGAPVLFRPTGVLHLECYVPSVPEPLILAGESFRARGLTGIARRVMRLRDRLERTCSAMRSQSESLVMGSAERIKRSKALAAAVLARVDRSRARRAALGPTVLTSALADADGAADVRAALVKLQEMGR